MLFFVFFYLLFLLAQENYNFYVSNKGNDSLPGTSEQLAKKTIAGVAPFLKIFPITQGIVRVGLKSGDIFDERLVTSYPIQINTYTDNSNQNDFAILNGTKEFSSGWERLPGTSYTFKQNIPYTGFVGYGINGIGSYSYMYVFETDRSLEKSQPFTARKPLIFLNNAMAVENTPGSFCIPVNTNENPMPVLIHTSDGSSPNANSKYRYEVTVRDWAVNSTYEQNNMFENLWVRGLARAMGCYPGEPIRIIIK